ncbi:MAG: S1C family serine protease [Verrucomicrobiota bacterium]
MSFERGGKTRRVEVKTMKRGVLSWGILVLLVLLVLLVVPGGVWGERHYFNDQKAPESLQDLANIQAAVQEILPKARAATICIELGPEKGSGTGVIVSAEGLVLTAAHVTGGVNKVLEARMEDGTVVPMRSLGLISTSDAAMAQLEGEGPFPFVEVEKLEQTRLGDWLMSLGHSGGFDEDRGLVVRLGRLVRIAQRTWQTDGTLIGGDSGGPLFDLHGRVVGIHSRVGQTKGENMSVPMHEFVENWEVMLEGEFVGEGPFAQRASGFLGVQLKDDEEKEEVLVEMVVPLSPAERGGVLAGDVILRIGEVEVETADGLREELGKLREGERVELTIRRQDDEQVVEVDLAGRD